MRVEARLEPLVIGEARRRDLDDQMRLTGIELDKTRRSSEQLLGENGKIRLKQTPLVNHWWNVTLYVTPVIFVYLDNFQHWAGAKFGRKKKHGLRAPEPVLGAAD